MSRCQGKRFKVLAGRSDRTFNEVHTKKKKSLGSFNDTNGFAINGININYIIA
ncbi:hypothetical protein [Gloeocapsa sp. PCC 73106]|uniref:hypothetical protein n=1 Tax=Gloeocapsa sp. PCC 73106 TaxID=102232 RepID=UPI0002D846D0|nr:hypothetical protein [Gloeocapsa sp. PCC 73106]